MTSSDHSHTASRRKRNMKCLACIVAGVIAQTIIILLFVMLVMRIRNPKVRLDGVTVENLKLNSSSSSPSFSMNLNALVIVKNTNFGYFKFQDNTLTVSYMGISVGDGTIVEARARARSTKKLNVTLSLSSSKISSHSALSSDIGSGILSLSSNAKLDGRIHLFKVFKKKKSAQMDCTMDVNTSSKQIENLSCK